MYIAEERRIQVAETQVATNVLAQRSPSPENDIIVTTKKEHHRPRLHNRFK